MKKNLIILAFAAGFSIPSFAQMEVKNKIDSLFTVLKTAKEDTAKVKMLNALADELRNTDPDTSIYFANQAQALSVKIGYKLGSAVASFLIGSTFTNLGDYDKALKYFNNSLTIYDQLLLTTSGTEKTGQKSRILMLKGRLLNNIGLAYWRQGNYAEALKNHFASLKIRNDIGDKTGIAYSYTNIGLIYRGQGKYSEALKNYNAGLEILEETKDKQGISHALSDIGAVYDLQGNYPEALKNYFATLEISEELGDKHAIAISYNNIGLIYCDQGNYTDALKNLLTALKIREEIRDKQGIADSYINIGSFYEEQGNYPEALKNYSAALKIKEEIGDKQGIADSYSGIGTIYYKQGNYNESLKNYFIALKIREEMGDKQGMALIYNSLGNTYLKQKKINNASQYLNQGLSLAKETGSMEDINNSYIGLAALDSLQGNFKKAFEHYKMYIITRDSMFNRENTKKIVQSKMQYEFDKKEAVEKAEQANKDALTLKEMQRQRFIRNSFMGGFSVVLLFAFIFFRQRNKISREKKISEAEKERSEELLLNILPAEVAEELKQTGHCQAKTFSMVTVMFTDFKDFTNVSEKVSAELLVDEINYCFSTFDSIIQKNKVEKIKTVGDAYICVSGLPVLNFTHATDVVHTAIEMRNFMLKRKQEKEARGEIPFELRIGIHTGPVVAGIVGVKKFQYDIWGDTVNLAARMESSGEAGQVNISGATYALVKDKFACTYRGKITAKKKGEIDMYFVDVANP